MLFRSPARTTSRPESGRGLKRGAVVGVAVSGDYGKPRPAVIVQSDRLDATDSLLVCLVTSDVGPASRYRLPVVPSAENGLRRMSDVMVDKIIAVPKTKIGRVFGFLDSVDLSNLDRMLAFAVGLADHEGSGANGV